MDEKEDSGFVRQRRNLMIVSLVLLFAEFTDLKIQKINAFGNELLIGEPQAAINLMWFAAIYWLIRYYQYSRGHFGSLNDAARTYLFGTFESIARNKIARENPKLLENINNINAMPRLSSQLIGQFYQGECFLITLRICKTISYNTEYAKQDATGYAKQDEGEFTTRLEGMELKWLRVKSWFHVIAKTTRFTDLVLPYIVFSAPVLNAGYKWLYH